MKRIIIHLMKAKALWVPLPEAPFSFYKTMERGDDYEHYDTSDLWKFGF